MVRPTGIPGAVGFATCLSFHPCLPLPVLLPSPCTGGHVFGHWLVAQIGGALERVGGVESSEKGQHGWAGVLCACWQLWFGGAICGPGTVCIKWL